MGSTDIIATVEARLSRYPHVRYTSTERSISVEPLDESGFEVWLSVDGDRITVGFAGWHEDFPTVRESLDCFALGLSDSCRLAVTYRGDTATKWVLESREHDDGPWLPDSKTGLLFVPFWRRKRVVHRQNRLISGPLGA